MPPTVRLLLSFFAALIAVLSIVLAAAALRLSYGPISAEFLSPYLREALSEGVGAFTVEFEEPTLGWPAWNRAFEIRARGVRVLTPAGVSLVSAPEISIGLSGRALMRGFVAPTRVDLIGPEFRLRIGRDGRFDWGASLGEGLVGPLAEELLKAPRPDRATGYLKCVSVLEADVTIDDEKRQSTWHAPRVDIVLFRGDARLRGSVAADIGVGESTARVSECVDDERRAPGVDAVAPRDSGGLRGVVRADLEVPSSTIKLSAEVEYAAATEVARVRLRFAELDPSLLAEQGPAFAPLRSFNAVIEGTAEFEVAAATGTTSEIAFDVDGGPGFLDLRQFFADRLAFDSISARGRLAPDLGSAELDEMVTHARGAVARLKAAVVSEPQGLAIVAAGIVERVAVADIPRYWPITLNPGGRQWFAENVSAGTITSAKFQLKVPSEVFGGAPIPSDIVDARFEFTGARARYWATFPDVTDGAGTGHITGSFLELRPKSARNGDIALSDGVIRLEGLNEEERSASIGAVGTGTLSEFLRILDHEPLRVATNMGIGAGPIEGLVAARAKFRFPVRRGLTAGDVSYAAAANVRGAAIPGLARGYDVDQGDLFVRVDGEGVGANGTVRINGVTAEVDWRPDLGSANPASGRYALKTTLTDAARLALGLPSNSALAGPVAATMEFTAQDGRISEAQVWLDLRDAALAVPALHWSKPRGVEGSARFVARVAEDGAMEIEDLEMVAGDLAVSGSIDLGAGGAFRRADFDRVSYGLNDVSLSLRPLQGGGYIAAVDGASFDLRPFTEELEDFSGQSSTVPLRLNARLTRLIVDDAIQLSGVDVRAERGRKLWESARIEGRFTDGEALALELSSSGERRRLTVTSADAGAFVRTLGYFDNAVGGRLALSAEIQDDKPGSPIRGVVRIDDFHIVGAPALARILTVASLSGITDILRGEGIAFVRFEAPFELADGAFTLREARAVGPSLGITIEGPIDRGRGTVDLSGTLVPAYTINSVLGNIPILGRLLTGGAGEGIFALTYRVSGRADLPIVSVNPLSALAPGFLRGFITALEGDEPPVPAGEDDIRGRFARPKAAQSDVPAAAPGE